VHLSTSQATSRHHVCTYVPRSHRTVPDSTYRVRPHETAHRLGSRNNQAGRRPHGRSPDRRPRKTEVNATRPYLPATPDRPPGVPNACLIAGVNKHRSVTVGWYGAGASRSGRAALSPSIARGTRWNLARGGAPAPLLPLEAQMSAPPRRPCTDYWFLIWEKWRN
jgi:hypothetical protein